MYYKEAIERCNELIKESSCWIGITNQQAIQIVLNIIKKQEEDIEDYEKILDIYDERKYRKQYLEEERAKRKNLLYPDSDEIYQRYFEQKEEIEKKDKIINDAIKWIENTMNDSRVTGCNLGDLQLLFDILKDKK